MEDRVEAQPRTGHDRDAGDGGRGQERAATLAELQRLVADGLASGISHRSKGDIRRLSREMAASGGSDRPDDGDPNREVPQG